MANNTRHGRTRAGAKSRKPEREPIHKQSPTAIIAESAKYFDGAVIVDTTGHEVNKSLSRMIKLFGGRTLLRTNNPFSSMPKVTNQSRKGKRTFEDGSGN